MGDLPFPIRQSQECQSGKSLKVLSEVLPRVLREIGVLGGCYRECSGKLGVQGVFPRVLFLCQSGKSLKVLSGAHPRALSLTRISHFRTPVTGGWDCNGRSTYSEGFSGKGSWSAEIFAMFIFSRNKRVHLFLGVSNFFGLSTLRCLLGSLFV